MNFKQVDWKYIFISAIAMIIFILIYTLITNQFSYYTLILSASIFPFIGLLISFSNIDSKQNKGCLNGKTKEEVIQFFVTLYNFIEKDLIFYNEQLTDLSEDELEQFNMWVFDNKYTLKKKT